MSLKRVVVTGLGAVSPFGLGMKPLMTGLLNGHSGITAVPELSRVKGLRCSIAGVAPEVPAEDIPRKFRRSMSRMSMFSYLSCLEALNSAGVSEKLRTSGRLGLAIGNTVGSPATYQEFFTEYLKEFSVEGVKSTLFFKIMGHTCAANVAQALNITGRVLAPSAACATGAQSLGLGFESISLDRQDLMLCGGAEELHPLTVGTFDIINAASTGFNHAAERAPRPFDRDRDGTVCSEGCGIVLLESLESALARGAEILAEVAGFATTSDTTNISNPDAASIEDCMRLVLDQAGMTPSQIGYVNAHATATINGDVAESQAIRKVFGDKTPVSSLKGHLGHSLAASGTMELAAVVTAMRQDVILPTRNLENIDPECGGLDHVIGPRQMPVEALMKNNFALGGVNVSVIVRRYS